MTLVPNYVPTDWVDTVTTVDEAKMDKIEAAVDAQADAINALDTRLAAEEAMPDIPTVVNGQWLKGSSGAMVWSAIAQSDVTGLPAALTAKQDVSAKGVANGYASLDSGGKVPTTQLPVSIDLRWAGTYAAATAYKEGDVVIYNGVSYIALRPNTGETPAPWSSAAGGALTYQEAVLASDGAPFPTQTWTDGLAISLAAGTWLVLANIVVRNTSAGATNFSARLWDGTTTKTQGGVSANVNASLDFTISMSGVFVLAAAGSVRSSAYASRANCFFPAQTVYQPQANAANYLIALKLA